MPVSKQVAGDPFYAGDGEGVVTVNKLFTRIGERLEVTADGFG